MRTFSAALLSFTLLVSAPGCTHSDNGDMALGSINTQQLLTNYTSFDDNFQSFTLSKEDINAIKTWPSDLRVEVFFGTWCHDSEREVPRFLKMLAHNPAINYQLIALDYQKVEPEGLTENKNIKFTPTFVIYHNEQEIGRVIERPEVSLVADISAML